MGLTGLIGFSSGYHAIMEGDTLLMLGTDFPYTQFCPEKATIIQVDRRGENLGRRTRLDLGIIGDVKATLRALEPLLEEKKDDADLKRFIHHYQDTRKGLDELAVGHPGHKPMHPQYVAKIVNEIAADDAIFSCDLGTLTVGAARYLGSLAYSLGLLFKILDAMIKGPQASRLVSVNMIADNNK